MSGQSHVGKWTSDSTPSRQLFIENSYKRSPTHCADLIGLNKTIRKVGHHNEVKSMAGGEQGPVLPTTCASTASPIQC